MLQNALIVYMDIHYLKILVFRHYKDIIGVIQVKLI